MIRVGDKKAAVNQSTVSINDVSIELSRTEISQQPDTEDNKEANTSVITVEKNDQSETDDKPLETKEVTFTIPQVEALLSELKTKHTSEKRLLQCDLMLMKKVMKKMSEKIKETNVSNIL